MPGPPKVSDCNLKEVESDGGYQDGPTMLGECFEVRHGCCIPYANPFILSSCREEFTVTRDCKGEDVVKMTGQILLVSLSVDMC